MAISYGYFNNFFRFHYSSFFENDLATQRLKCRCKSLSVNAMKMSLGAFFSLGGREVNPHVRTEFNFPATTFFNYIFSPLDIFWSLGVALMIPSGGH
jgi:hypothetical protein